MSAPARQRAVKARQPAPEAGAVLTIDLGALANNWRSLRDRAAGAECAAVVKADAYGTSIEPAVGTLAAAGCRTFFVAHLSEAARVRATSSSATIYVLNGLMPETAPAFAAGKLRPVLGSLEEIRDWAAYCADAGRMLPAAIHVDTGMNRLGISPGDAMRLASDPAAIGVTPTLVMSHFVSAEIPHDPLNRRQIEAFGRIAAAFPGVPASLSNSSGVFLPASARFDMVRPGYALYGGNPTPAAVNPMRPVVGLEARVIQLRAVEPGETVGYNARWTAPAPGRLATISIGYGDGYPRAAGNTDVSHAGGIAIVAGRRCPFAGPVSMDLIVVDVTDVPEGAVRRGDRVVLIGPDITVDEVGRRAGTNGYEVLTRLGRRYARAYLGR